MKLDIAIPTRVAYHYHIALFKAIQIHMNELLVDHGHSTNAMSYDGTKSSPPIKKVTKKVDILLY